MKDYPPLKRGDQSISAEKFNALVEEVKRLGKIEVSDATVDNSPGGIYIGAKRPRPAFWARLTAELVPSVYGWVEVERSAIGAFTDLQYGRVFDGTNFAVGTNLTAGLPTDATHGYGMGLVVWLELGHGEPNSGGVTQEWIFRDTVGGGGGTRFSGANVQWGGTLPFILSVGQREIAPFTQTEARYDTDSYIEENHLVIREGGIYALEAGFNWRSNFAVPFPNNGKYLDTAIRTEPGGYVLYDRLREPSDPVNPVEARAQLRIVLDWRIATIPTRFYLELRNSGSVPYIATSYGGPDRYFLIQRLDVENVGAPSPGRAPGASARPAPAALRERLGV